MASAWGKSWGAAWGASWGAISATIAPESQPSQSGGVVIRRGKPIERTKRTRAKRENDILMMRPCLL